MVSFIGPGCAVNVPGCSEYDFNDPLKRRSLLAADTPEEATGGRGCTALSWYRVCVCVCVCVRARVCQCLCVCVCLHECACAYLSLHVFMLTGMLVCVGFHIHSR